MSSIAEKDCNFTDKPRMFQKPDVLLAVVLCITDMRSSTKLTFVTLQ